MTKISALTSLAGGSVDAANDVLAIVDTSASTTKKITVADLIGLVTDIAGLLDFKGATDCSANPNYPAASKGDYYLVSVAGKIGGAAGTDVTGGDSYFAIADNAGGTQAGVGTSWTVIQGNITYVPVDKAGDTMSGDLAVPDEAYDATAWNGSFEVPTKNAVRDKIEAVVAGGSSGTVTSVGTSGLATGGPITGSGTVDVPAATGSDYRTGTDATKALTSDAAWDAADYVALNDSGGNIAVDLATGINFTMTMDGDYTLSAPSNGKPGQSGCIVLTQDGTGTQTLAYNAAWKFAGGTDPTLSTAASTVDILFYQVLANGTDVFANLVKAVA